jgi:hypothetical protein
MSVYWYGGSGNWSDHTNHWSNNSGNSPSSPLGHAPTASESVVFDANSASDNYTVTVTGNGDCLDFIMDKPTGVGKKITFNNGIYNISISGNMNLVGGSVGITFSGTGQFIFVGTSGIKTIATNSAIFTQGIAFNGEATFQLIDNLISNRGGGNTNFILTAGTVDFTTNNTTISIISSAGIINGEFTFYDLSLIPTTPTSGTNHRLRSNIIVTHGLTITNGITVTNRSLIYSYDIGIQKTITITGTTANDFSNVDFKDINVINIVDGNQVDLDLSNISGLSGDCGGNDGITFTTGVDQYWYKSSGASNNWSTITNWYLGTGGSGGVGRVPLPQDQAIFDDLSFGAEGMTITQNMPRIPSTTFCGDDGLHPVENNPTFTTSSGCSVFGSLILTPNMTLTASTQQYTFEGRGDYILTSAGKTWAKIIAVYNAIGILRLGDDFNSSTYIYTGYSGRFDANDHNVTIAFLYNAIALTTAGYIIDMGNGTWTINALYPSTTNLFWYSAGYANMTFNAEGSTLKFIDSSNTNGVFTSYGYTFNNIWFDREASTGSNTLTYSSTYNEIKDTGTVAHSLLLSAGTTKTVNTFTVNGTAGNLITLASTTTTKATLLVNSSKIRCEFLNVDYIIGSPVNSVYMRSGTCIDGGHNSQVYFIDWISITNTGNMKSGGYTETETGSDPVFKSTGLEVGEMIEDNSIIPMSSMKSGKIIVKGNFIEY